MTVTDVHGGNVTDCSQMSQMFSPAGSSERGAVSRPLPAWLVSREPESEGAGASGDAGTPLAAAE